MVFRRSYFLLFSSLENGLLINIEDLKPFSNVLRKLKQFLGRCDPFWDSFDKGALDFGSGLKQGKKKSHTVLRNSVIVSRHLPHIAHRDFRGSSPSPLPPPKAKFLTPTSRWGTSAFFIILNNLFTCLKLSTVLLFGFSNKSQFVCRRIFG